MKQAPFLSLVAFLGLHAHPRLDASTQNGANTSIYSAFRVLQPRRSHYCHTETDIFDSSTHLSSSCGDAGTISYDI
jgi:hypothetical protein